MAENRKEVIGPGDDVYVTTRTGLVEGSVIQFRVYGVELDVEGNITLIPWNDVIRVVKRIKRR